MGGKSSRKNKKLSNMLKIVVSVIIVVFILLIASLGLKKREVSEQKDERIEASSIEENLFEQVEEAAGIYINLGHGMYITEIGKYTGIYMEDGSDELVSDIMMIMVTNEGEHTIQYAEIMMPVGDKEAIFKLSTLIPGSTMVLLEQGRMSYTEENYTVVEAENVAIFEEDLSVYEDCVKIQKLNGAMNIANVSDANIDGNIIIYYKNKVSGLLYGGITYRVRIEGGLKKGEVKQVMTAHLTENQSEIMFVTIAKE